MINMTAGTSILILMTLLIRKIFWKKCSPNVIYFLWIFVAFRILVPVNIPLELPTEVEADIHEIVEKDEGRNIDELAGEPGEREEQKEENRYNRR